MVLPFRATVKSARARFRRLAQVTKPLAMVHASYLAEVDRWLAEQGVDTAALFDEIGLARERVRMDPDFFVPTRVVFHFCQRAEELVGMPDLGWRIGASVDLDAFPAFAAAWERASNLQSMMTILVRELRADTNRMPVWLRPMPEATWFCFGLSLAQDAPGSSFVEQHDMQIFLRTVRRVLGRAWQPGEVQFARASLTAREMLRESLSGVSLSSGRFSSFPMSLLDLKTPLEPRPTPEASALRDREVAPQDLVSSLRAALHAMLAPSGPPPVEQAARLVGLSRRTLQRQLANEGTSYSEVLADLRSQLAVELVSDTDLRLHEITRELGYTDPAHFTRAFRRWTGSTPGAYRRATAG